MAISRQQGVRLSPDLSLVLLTALLVILWLTGGASREDVSGQIFARGAAWIAIVTSVVFARPPRIAKARGTALILGAAILLCVVQLIPLPPSLWRSMPGRTAFTNPLISPPDLWRPWSLVPGATVNALFSLVVPVSVLVLAAGIAEERKHRLPVAVLATIALSLLVGLLQFTGAEIVNPFVNGTPGVVDGMIANRNHFALLLAIGLLITPVWGVEAGSAARIRAPAALGLVLLLVLAILASGSRAGIALGIVALVLGFVISRRQVKSALRRYPRWTLPAIGAGVIALIAIFVLVSFTVGRAASIDRLIVDDASAGMRSRGLPTVLAMIRAYFPFGSGLGSFDPIFRLHEPFSLLKPTYFNHAHNDFLETVLTAGLPGLLLLTIAIAWWAWRSVAAWRNEAALPKLGSATLLLILLASIVDYPARTPIIMAIATIAAIWLGGAGRGSGTAGEASLPTAGRKL